MSIVLIPTSDVLDNGVPRILPNAQRSINMKAWHKRVGPWDLRKVGVPTLVRINGVLYIIDGQHRIKGYDFENITQFYGSVLELSSEKEAAEMFLGLSTNRPITVRDRTRIAITAEDPAWMDIVDTLSRFGFRLRGVKDSTKQGDFYTLEGDATVKAIYDKGQLSNVLTIYKFLGERWASNGKPSRFLKNLACFLETYPALSLDEISYKLSKTSLFKLENEANGKDETTRKGFSLCFQWALVDAYNRSRKSGSIIKKNS